MKLRQESVAEFDKAVAVLDAQPDPSKEGPHEKKIRAFADKVRAQVNRSVSVQNFRHKKRQSEGKGDEWSCSPVCDNVYIRKLTARSVWVS